MCARVSVCVRVVVWMPEFDGLMLEEDTRWELQMGGEGKGKESRLQVGGRPRAL